jgi:hypothetical protein
LTISEERKKRVIDLYYNQGKTMREIAKIERMSIRDISAIIKEEEARRQKHKQQEIFAQAYQLFSEGKTTVEVAIELNLPASKVSKLYREYWKLKGLDKLYTIYKETNGKLWIVLKLYKELIKKKSMNIEQAANAADTDINKLPYMESLYRQAKDEAEKMQRTIQGLANEVEARKNKISLLDQTAFPIELDCRRKEQQVQELGHKKDRMENLITNILNGEAYSKLKQIIKEDVKVLLSENRKLISISFVALMLTLKNDPQMVNVLYKIDTANDGEQHKDDNSNNMTKYLESNKATIVDLAEKNYENPVEALTNNAISSAAASSLNPTLSLSQSSSTFSNPFDQIDTYRIKEPENYHNSKGDIAD